MKQMINRTHIEGLLYEHSLTKKVSGDNSKNPGTEFITGSIDIATDDAMINIVQVHFTYVTAKTKDGKENPTYTALSNIISGVFGTIMRDGKDSATRVRVDSAIGLNDFYSEKDGNEELVSLKRNEGGFVHTTGPWADDENARNTFEVDMVITGTKRTEADDERHIPEKVILKGAIFDFRGGLLPVELSVTNASAMDYFEGLDASSKNPVFTKLKGNEISETIVRTITEEGAFGEDSVREVKSSRKDYVVTWAAKDAYDFSDDGDLSPADLKTAMENRNVYLADVKKRYEDYKANKGNAGMPFGDSTPKGSTFTPEAAKSNSTMDFDF